MKYEERDEASALRSAHERAARDSTEPDWRARAERAEAEIAALNAQIAALTVAASPPPAPPPPHEAPPPGSPADALRVPRLPDGTPPQVGSPFKGSPDGWDGFKVGDWTYCGLESNHAPGCLRERRVLERDDFIKGRLNERLGEGVIHKGCSVCRAKERDKRDKRVARQVKQAAAQQQADEDAAAQQ